MTEVSFAHFTLADWLSYQQQLHAQVIELGLQRVKVVADRLSLVPTCPVMMVAGTNGKGSTCAFLQSILRAAGYRVGVYTSPHLVRYNERIVLDDQPVSDERICRHFEKIELARQDITLTPFEFGTLAAVSIFNEAQVEVMVLEVGLGGRLDAVNIFNPSVSIITSIDIDHVDYLGDNREDIGREKAGIFRPSVPAICADLNPPLSVLHQAEQIGAPLFLLGRDFDLVRQAEDEGLSFVSNLLGLMSPLPEPALQGEFQWRNAAAAMAALLLLKNQLPVNLRAIQQGLRQVFVAGRYQVLSHVCTVILDVAHNPQGARELSKNLLAHPVKGRTWMVFGMLRDKDISGVIATLVDQVDEWLVADVPDLRGESAAQLRDRIESAGGIVRVYDSFERAIEAGLLGAQPEDRIVVTGSFVTVGLVADYLARLA